MRHAIPLAALLLAAVPLSAQAQTGQRFCNNAIAVSASGRPETEGARAVYRYIASVTGPGLSMTEARTVNITFAPPAGPVRGGSSSVSVGRTGVTFVTMGSEPWDFPYRNSIASADIMRYVTITCP